MAFGSCPGKDSLRNAIITEKTCPQCGNVVEVFSCDTEVVCDKCGFVIYNDALTCARWCSYAKSCLGPEMYEFLKARLDKADEELKKKQEKEA